MKQSKNIKNDVVLCKDVKNIKKGLSTNKARLLDFVDDLANSNLSVSECAEKYNISQSLAYRINKGYLGKNNLAMLTSMGYTFPVRDCSNRQLTNEELHSLVKAADIDFTELDYVETFLLLNTLITDYPDYLGSTIQIKGTYLTDDLGMYHCVFLEDDEGCCSGLLEFILPEGQEYPHSGSEIEVYGTYTLSTDTMGSYVYLDVEDFTVKTI